MMALKQFNKKTAKTPFIFRRNPAHAYSYVIMGTDQDTGEYVQAGEYTVIETSEDVDLTEKKIINLVNLLNGDQDLMQLGTLTKTRLLFNIVPGSADSEKTKIIFRTHDGKGVSQENAVLVLEKGVLNDELRSR